MSLNICSLGLPSHDILPFSLFYFLPLHPSPNLLFILQGILKLGKFGVPTGKGCRRGAGKPGAGSEGFPLDSGLPFCCLLPRTPSAEMVAASQNTRPGDWGLVLEPITKPLLSSCRYKPSIRTCRSSLSTVMKFRSLK